MSITWLGEFILYTSIPQRNKQVHILLYRTMRNKVVSGEAVHTITLHVDPRLDKLILYLSYTTTCIHTYIIYHMMYLCIWTWQYRSFYVSTQKLCAQSYKANDWVTLLASSIVIKFSNFTSDGMWCCRSDWPGLSLFFCYQPSWVASQQGWFGPFRFFNFPNFTPPPPRRPHGVRGTSGAWNDLWSSRFGWRRVGPGGGGEVNCWNKTKTSYFWCKGVE